MGGAPSYAKQRRYTAMMNWKKHNVYKDVVDVRKGKGQYPKCTKIKPYDFCPEEEISETKNVPSECKNCPNYTESKYFKGISHKDRLKRLKESGLPTRIEG